MNNQLLEVKSLPDFKLVQTEDVGPAVEKRLEEYKSVVEKVKSLSLTEISWDNSIALFEEVEANLSSTWSLVSHLNAVMHTDELEKVHEKYEQVITDFATTMGQDQDLFAIYNSLKESDSFSSLSQEQQRTIDLALTGFKLSGVDLEEVKRKDLKEMFNEEAKLETQFSLNVLKATQEWSIHISDIKDLEGLPEINISMASDKAKVMDKEGYVLGLDAPTYIAVMTYCKNRDLREKVYRAYVTRCSSLSEEKDYDNTESISQIMSLRKKISAMLGYDNYAEYALAKNMANTAKEVEDFLRDLLSKAKVPAKEQMSAVIDFAKTHGVDNFSPWDYAFYSELQQQELFDFSSESIKEYFKEDKAWDALFKLTKDLFAIEIKEEPAKLWHDHAKLFKLYDKENNVIGAFYSDLYAREGKRQGAWMSDYRTRYTKPDGSSEVPVAFLVANFTGPTSSAPSLLSHDEVITLFHEFGHTIHHLISTIDVYSVSGGHGVSWDAIELPSQFMENWCWEWDLVKDMSGHYKTSESMPKDLFDKLFASKKHNAGLFLCRQIEFALFDEMLHINQDGDKDAVQQVLNNVRDEIDVFPVAEYNRFQNTFSHIFAGGYSANYYSYLWAEMLSTDAYAMFKENGTFNQEVALGFKKHILSAGGSEPMHILYKKFRGREPNNDALLEEYGIAK